MSLFKPTAQAAPAFLKMGIYGDPGTGKTFTATSIAIGLAQLIGKSGTKPSVFFLDTETGAEWVRPRVEQAGLPFVPATTRAFADLKAAVKEAEAQGAILIVDSMTHFWEEIRDSYLAAKRERLRNEEARLELPDWNVIKPEWGKFTQLFLNSRTHIILCGRAGSIYEFQERDDGKKEMISAGTRMAAEKGMGYEPNLLVEMTARQVVARGKGAKPKTIVRTATVLKDRSDILDGLQFVDPTFEHFLPHIQRLNLGGDHTGIDTTRTSKALFPSDGESRDPRAARRRVALGDIQDLLVLHIPGQSAPDKQRKIQLLRKHFNAGWAEMEELMSLEQLQAGLRALRAELEPAKAVEAPPENAAAPVDTIPHQEPAVETDQGAVVPLGKEAAEVALHGFRAALAGAHSLNKITREWNKWDAAYQQCDKLTQAEFLRVKAEAMKRVRESAELVAAK